MERQWASTESPYTGRGYKQGDRVEFLGWVAGELVNGISEWWVDTEGHRLWTGGLVVKPKVDPEYGKSPSLVPGMGVVSGFGASTGTCCRCC